MNYSLMLDKYLKCESCIYYEDLYGYNEKGCSLGICASFCDSFPCSHYIEDAKHYKNRTEVKKPTKVKEFKVRKNIREIE